MSENQGEDASIGLTVDADEALTVFEQLSQAARDADEQIQQLKQHLAQQVTATFGAQGLRPQTYEQASGFLSRMDPAEVAQAAPDIAQTKNALVARSADIQARAMDFAGSTPNLAAQPPADVLAQFQQSMAAREQQQTAQQQRQAQQAAAGIERPARYGYDQSAPPAPSHASFAPITATTVPTMQATGTTTMAPLATTGDERLAQALSAPTPTGASAPGRATTDTPSLASTASTGELPDDLQRLAVAAIAADEGIRRLQQHLVEQVNADMGQAGIRPQTFEQAQDLLGRMPPADLAAAAPDVVVTQQRIAARSAEVTGQVAAFGEQASRPRYNKTGKIPVKRPVDHWNSG